MIKGCEKPKGDVKLYNKLCYESEKENINVSG